MDIRPNLGVRIKLAAKGSGLWQESAGDKSVFGLNAAQAVDVVEVVGDMCTKYEVPHPCLLYTSSSPRMRPWLTSFWKGSLVVR